MSTYNVAPQQAGQYFNKIQCFCFEEQRLRPGEKIDMPVFFYIDPEFATDPKMKGINTITLRCAGGGEGQGRAAGSGAAGGGSGQRCCKVGADRRCASSACTAPELAGRSSNVPLLPPCCCAWPAATLSSKPRRRSLRRRSPQQQQQQQRQRQHLVSPPWRPSKTVPLFFDANVPSRLLENAVPGSSPTWPARSVFAI